MQSVRFRVDFADDIWWSMQEYVLSPACHAGAHVVVGIAGQHRHLRALAASIELSSPAR
jgi:hypothetical protein